MNASFPFCISYTLRMHLGFLLQRGISPAAQLLAFRMGILDNGYETDRVLLDGPEDLRLLREALRSIRCQVGAGPDGAQSRRLHAEITRLLLSFPNIMPGPDDMPGPDEQTKGDSVHRADLRAWPG